MKPTKDVIMLNRSTKGASKLRRELINIEIGSIRDLLPLPDGIRRRLSQLQVMAVCKAFIGKDNFFSKISDLRSSASEEILTDFDFQQALPGFLLLADAEGKFLYLSDNVMEILGHSMVDFVTQSDSALHLFDEKGQTILTELLSGVHGNGGGTVSASPSSEFLTDEVTFTCMLGLSRHARRHPGLDRQKAMKVKARLLKPTNYLSDSGPVLAAFCLPCSPVFPAGGDRTPGFSTMICQSGHSADMKFIKIDSNLEWHLGYNIVELRQRSWYDFLHPDHESEFAEKHLQLISSSTSFTASLFARLQTKFGHFVWMHLLMRVKQSDDDFSDQSEITCVGHVLDEEEVAFMKEREQKETEYSNFFASFDNSQSCCSLFPFSMDEGMMAPPPNYLVSAADPWTNGKEKKASKRRAVSREDKRPRKTQLLEIDEEEDTVSTTTADSTTYLDFDQFGKQEAFSIGPAFPDFYQRDFELKSEACFLPSAVSPLSILSESLSSNSPRTFSEDENSFFAVNSISSKTPPSLLLPFPFPSSSSSSKSLSDADALLLPSPTQEVPSELPELDLADLNAYLQTVEYGKKQEAGLAFCTPSYAERSWQQQQQQPNGLGCEVEEAAKGGRRQGVRGEEAFMATSSSQFSESAFLERLIGSPQFTQLIGLMAGGAGGAGTGSQRRTGPLLLEHGLPSHG